jgi:ABC-2 type transport system permease protein
MRDIWRVCKHDIGVTLRQRSFWFLTLLKPLLLMALNAGIIVQDSGQGTAGDDAGQGQAADIGAGGTTAIGLVDEVGLLVEIPPDLPAGLFVHFPDQAAARQALESGEIVQYIYIPADYVASGEVAIYDQNFQILQGGEGMGVAFGSNDEWILQYLLDYNLVGDKQLLLALQNPIPGNLTEPHTLAPAAESSEETQALARIVSSVTPYVYYFLLVLGSSYLMRSVVAEKENRTAEVLLLSLPPHRLMVGKVLAMSFVTLIQALVWVGGSMLLLNRGADLLQAAKFTFPPGFIIWAILFLMLGFLLYASIMAAAGTIATSAREAGQVTFLLIIPLMPTLMFGDIFLRDPNGILSTVLSLFPFSAPSAMVTRLAVAPVPTWQILASLVGLAATTYLFVLLSGRFFRAGNLLSQEPFNWRRLATGWRR